MFTEDKNHKDRKKVQEDTDSLDKWSRTMANTKIFIFDEDIKYLQSAKIIRTERKLQENIESLDNWSRIWQIQKYLFAEDINIYRGQK